MGYKVARIAVCALVWSPGIAHAAKLGETCGGIAGLQCDAGLWCETRAGMCGVVDATGTCLQVPQICPQVFIPVCACNGRTYPNDCQRRSNREPKQRDGSC